MVENIVGHYYGGYTEPRERSPKEVQDEINALRSAGAKKFKKSKVKSKMAKSSRRRNR